MPQIRRSTDNMKVDKKEVAADTSPLKKVMSADKNEVKSIEEI